MDHFSSVVAPLTAFTGATGKGRARKPIQAIDWNNLSEEQVKAFQEIKQLLVTAPAEFNYGTPEQELLVLCAPC